MTFRFANTSRKRLHLTKAVCKAQTDTSKLVDLFENRKAVLVSEASEPGLNGPATMAKANKEFVLLRSELLRRGVKAELLDWTEGNAEGSVVKC
jgi:hypothetical protein